MDVLTLMIAATSAGLLSALVNVWHVRTTMLRQIDPQYRGPVERALRFFHVWRGQR